MQPFLKSLHNGNEILINIVAPHHVIEVLYFDAQKDLDYYIESGDIHNCSKQVSGYLILLIHMATLPELPRFTYKYQSVQVFNIKDLSKCHNYFLNNLIKQNKKPYLKYKISK